MAFHIDIIPAVHIPTGKVDWHYEVGYTIQDCVDQSWLDPMVPGGLWTRKEIDRSFDPEDEEHAQEYRPVDPARIPDPEYGKNLELNLKLVAGRWVHDEGTLYLR